MFILGIDPGLKGGLALIDDTGSIRYIGQTQVAGKEIVVRRFVELITGYSVPVMAVMEKVHSMPRQSSQSTFRFGEGYGKIKGILETLNTRYELVHPQTWKKEILHGTDKSKQAAIEWVNRVYPGVDLRQGKKVPSDGIADALCLAEYGRRKFLNAGKL